MQMYVIFWDVCNNSGSDYSVCTLTLADASVFYSGSTLLVISGQIMFGLKSISLKLCLLKWRASGVWILQPHLRHIGVSIWQISCDKYVSNVCASILHNLCHVIKWERHQPWMSSWLDVRVCWHPDSNSSYNWH